VERTVDFASLTSASRDDRVLMIGPPDGSRKRPSRSISLMEPFSLAEAQSEINDYAAVSTSH
jgi:hypothetical protein